MKGDITIRSEVTPPYFEQLDRKKNDEKLIRDNSNKLKEIFSDGFSIKTSKDIKELSDMVGNDVAHAVVRSKLGRAKFESLMR